MTLMMHLLTRLINRSHTPPCQGLFSLMNLHLTAFEDRYSNNFGDVINHFTSLLADLSVFALSLQRVEGEPLRPQNLRNAFMNASTSSDSNNSR